MTPATDRSRFPARRGAAWALAAAVLFGVATPAIQWVGAGVGPFAVAALLYAGAAAVGASMRRPTTREAAVVRGDLPRIVAMAAFGALLGPVALAFGLQRTGAAAASLMLTMEAVFTAAIAFVAYRETVGGRAAPALAATTIGAMAVAVDRHASGSTQWVGLVAVVVATLAWAVDNTLSRGVADRDPGRVVAIKSALGAAAAGTLATLLGEPLPSLAATAGLLAIGASGYGLSLACYLRAQRSFGAARTASLFAVGPFVGAAVAWATSADRGGVGLFVGAAAMLAGVVLHLTERHAHVHDHPALEHAHPHDHDDGHHDHVHDPMPVGPHSHPHVHRPRRHAHPHVPDAHHLHAH